MPSGLLLGMVLIPSMVFLFVVIVDVLPTCQGVPCYILFSHRLPAGDLGLANVASFPTLIVWWEDLATTIAWASLVQAILGIGLIMRAVYNKESTVPLLVATTLSGFPFLLRLIR